MNVVFRLAKVLLNSGIATIVNGLSGLALSFLYVRFVGLDLFGQMSLILMVATLVFNFASIGILSGVTRILTEHLPKEKERSSFVLSVFIVTFILIILFSFPTFALVVS